MTEEQSSNSLPDDAAAETGVFDSSDSFFDALDNDISQGVKAEDNQGEAEETQTSEVQEVTQQNVDPIQTKDQEVDWEKRYKDSSREAQRLNAELKQFEPIKPLVDYMKRDSGLVDTIRGYLQNGGKTPTSVQDKLNLSEDFIFDGHEAVTDPKSESAQVLNQMVEGTVQRRVNNILEQEKQVAKQNYAKQEKLNEAQEFMKKNNMSEEDFSEMIKIAQGKKFTYDDMYYLQFNL